MDWKQLTDNAEVLRKAHSIMSINYEGIVPRRHKVALEVIEAVNERLDREARDLLARDH